MNKQTTKLSDVRANIRKVAEKVSQWPQWKRGGSAATMQANRQQQAAGDGRKKQSS